MFYHRTWEKAHPELFKHSPYQPKYQKPFTLILYCENEFFTAVATWEKRNGIWKCIQADTVISWMKAIPRQNLKLEMLRKGITWKWVNPLTQGNPAEFDRISAG